MKNLPLIITACLVSACSHSFDTPQDYLASKSISPPSTENFQHCHGYGCKHISEINFTQSDWHDMLDLFAPLHTTPAKEREQIAEAIAFFEQVAGAQAGTANDHWGTFKKTGADQHDCVDESINTTIYLMLLDQRNLIKHHTIAAPVSKWPIRDSGRWPHQSALIKEKQSGAAYVVDSWFHNNGHPPEIVTLKAWKAGHKPNRGDDS